MLREQFHALGDFVLDGHHIVGMTFLEDLPQGGAEVGQVLAWSGEARWHPVTLAGTAEPTVVTWDSIAGVPSLFPPSAHTHITAHIADFPDTWAWNSLTGVPSTFPPSAHTHTTGDITDFPTTWAWTQLSGVPSLVNSIIAGTGINVSTSTGNVTISVSPVEVAASIEVVLGDGLSALRDATDEEDFVDVVVPYAMTVREWVLVHSVLTTSTSVGELELDVQVCTSGAYPPEDTDGITGTATHLPVLDGTDYVESKTGLSWSLSAGNVMRVIVVTNSVSDVAQCTLSLIGVRS